MKIIEIAGKTVQYAPFNNLHNAKDFQDRAIGLHLIVHGDNDQYWVASGRSASRLVKAGYEYAE